MQTTLPFVGQFCRSLGAQSTTQSWHTDPLTPKYRLDTLRRAWSVISRFTERDECLRRCRLGPWRALKGLPFEPGPRGNWSEDSNSLEECGKSGLADVIFHCKTMFSIRIDSVWLLKLRSLLIHRTFKATFFLHTTYQMNNSPGYRQLLAS